MKKRILLLLLVPILALASCTDLTELNQDPTKSTTINPNLLITNIQFMQAFGYNNCTRYMIYPGAFCNHFTGPWSNVEYGGKGKKSTSYMERLWVISYPEIIWDIVALEELTRDKAEYVNQHAMAKLLRVEVFSRLTDYYGDIPYFEAGQGYFQGNLNPRYDKQKDIYHDFFKQIDEALALFDPTLPAVTEDLYFSGDIAKWQRFANSLKLRLAMRLVKVEPENAKVYAAQAVASGVMQSNDDTAFVKYDNNKDGEGTGNGYANALNSMYNSNYGPTQYRITTELLKALIIQGPDRVDAGTTYRTIEKEDPRLLTIARSYTAQTMDKASDITVICRDFNASASNKQGPADLSAAVDGYVNIGGYLTVPAQEFNYGGGIQTEYGVNKPRSIWANAITQALCPELPVASVTHYVQRLQPSKWLQASNSPWIHLSYAETQFLLAETTLRGWNIDSETAASRYRKGLEAAVKQWSIFGNDVPSHSDSEINDYIDARIPRINAGGNTALEEVTTQLWILFIMDPIEAWSLIRRTNGMPSEFVKFHNRYPTENETGGLRPRRMQYPMEEQTKNKKNYEEAVERMGGADDWMTPIWWDVQ